MFEYIQVIPIEGSMAENRGRYPCYLHISLALLSSILGSFGTLGYLRYGNETNQIVTENLEGSAIVIALRCLLFFGVLFTYPLQIYPVIQIFEGLIFGPNSSCARRLYRRYPSVNGEIAESSDGGIRDEDDDDTIISPAVKVNLHFLLVFPSLEYLLPVENSFEIILFNSYLQLNTRKLSLK